MGFEFGEAFDSFKEGTKEVAEIAHAKTSEFHESYVSKVIPDCGKYGDAARFVAEMAPGVSEYNAIREGDWQAFAIAAGVDIAAVAAGAFTFGAGYAAVKGGGVVAKTGVKVAAREVAEAGAKKVAKEVVETSTKKVVKEVVETGTEKVAKEVVETGVEKVAKEVVETGAEKVTKEVVETGAEKVVKEVAENGSEKVAKEVTEEGMKKADNVIHRYIECRNQGLEGKRHPITGVEFIRKSVDDGAGEIVEGVFPKFESTFDAKLPKDLFEESNFKQFKEANEQLYKQIIDNPSMKNKFSPEQIEQIKDGITTGAAPDGFTWHHNEECGVLQLVDYVTHANTGHTGGRAIWGGGY